MIINTDYLGDVHMKTNYKVSVALCTYNGEKYIREQLDSIFSQTMRPDEVVICDDCSSDNTISIIKEYMQSHTEIKLYENESNLGYKVNFANAINLCSGDYIFLSDQDDFWANNKIEKMLYTFLYNQSVSLVASNIDLVDENGKTIRPFFKKNFVRNVNKSNKQWRLIIKKPRFPGMCFAIKKELLERCNPFPSTYHHDEWLSTIASFSNGIYVLNDVLSFYRQHQSQTIGLKTDIKKSAKENKIATDEICKTDVLLKYCNDKSATEPIKLVKSKKRFYVYRVKQRERNFFVSFLISVVRLDMFFLYCRFCSKPLLSIVKDIAICKKGENK